MTKKTPDYIKQNDDGSIDVTLAKPATINGVKMTVMRMREPTVNDSIVSGKAGDDEQERAAVMIANLCEQPPEEIRKLTLRNFERLGSAFALFID